MSDPHHDSTSEATDVNPGGDVGAIALKLIEALSRQIRTPLQNIIGVSETLARTELSAEQAQLVRIVVASADALAGIVSNLTGEVRETGGASLVPPVLPTPADSPSHRLRVLLADDHPINQEVVRVMLADQADVTVVSHGAAALEAFERGRFDIVLMDTEMPVLGGLPAIRGLRLIELERSLARTPVISISASAMPKDVDAALGAGADAHVAKPISAATLLRTISDVLAPAAPATRRAGVA